MILDLHKIVSTRARGTFSRYLGNSLAPEEEPVGIVEKLPQGFSEGSVESLGRSQAIRSNNNKKKNGAGPFTATGALLNDDNRPIGSFEM